MEVFIEVAANKKSLAMRKLAFGVGTNDAGYIVKPVINGIKYECPYYRTWKDMLKRCYSSNLHGKYPTYADCSVDDKWLTFSVFRLWMEKQDWEGKALDKDIIKPGNKVYSSDTCIFVTLQINNLLCDSRSTRGEHPRGVSFNKNRKKFKAYCSVYGKIVHLGYFDSPIQASNAYIRCKYNHALEVAETQVDVVKKGLIRHAKLLLSTLNNIA